MPDYVTTETLPDGTQVEVLWYCEELLEQWTDEPISFWEMYGKGEDGSVWTAGGEATGDFGLNYVEVTDIDDVELVAEAEVVA